ncbi:hypothetical protein pipiens_020198, partial [Culex pipiens pipiens]
SRNQDTSPAPSSTNSQPSDGELGGGGKLARKCHARIEEISAWTVDNVCDFVSSIDICAEYVQLGFYDPGRLHATFLTIRSDGDDARL